MSHSRMDSAVGTLFFRMTGMIRAGGIKWEDRPLWYDVYAAFPPKHRPMSKADVQALKEMPVRRLLYPEDEIRAQFYKTYGSPGFINMTDEATPSICETFITKYTELAKTDPNRDADELFASTSAALASQGITLRKKGPAAPTAPEDPSTKEGAQPNTLPSQTIKA